MSCNRLVLAVYISYMSQNVRLLQVSNLSVQNFRSFLLMWPGKERALGGIHRRAVAGESRHRCIPIHTHSRRQNGPCRSLDASEIWLIGPCL